MGSTCSKNDQLGKGLADKKNLATIGQSSTASQGILNPSKREEMADSGSLEGQWRDDKRDIEKGFTDQNSYLNFREHLVLREKSRGFEWECQAQATDTEKAVDEIIQALRERDAAEYKGAEERKDADGQLHPRVPGDHFLSNRDLIEETALFEVAQKMPKGAHLHIHFNSCLQPSFLLDIAEEMERMFIFSDMPLVPDNNYENYKQCKIQFQLCDTEVEKKNPGDLYHPEYRKGHTMKLRDFLAKFPRDYCDRSGKVYESGKKWLMDKLVFHEEEAHNCLQTASGAWKKFNARTQMMKGLFNYETAFRKYTRACLEDFVRDNIQYAEIRPNFMRTNQLCRDDGTGSIDNEGIMRIIIDEVTGFKDDITKDKGYFAGVKVIYCAPRSFENEKVREALTECLEFKKKWPQWIAGFDLVGEEAKNFPLKQFIPEFLQFQKECEAAGLEIPFLFHCGETLDVGTDTDGNLVDALLLKSKRIGHGFALTRHPLVMQHMKDRGVCLELCPISNEILGLTPRVGGHTMYELLANNVHCTVNSDNGTLFRSTLSHDFYQVMIGKADMGLAGWKQLILWSIEHSCMSKEEREETEKEWQVLWKEFLDWVGERFKQYKKSTKPVGQG